jgi:tetratricopeptide (TPR) repeat protein
LPSSLGKGKAAVRAIGGFHDMKRLCLFLLMISAAYSSPLAQQSSEQQLNRLSILEQQGRFADVIQPASHLINTDTLRGDQLGRAQLILGIAYHQSGDLPGAKNEYERAVSVLSRERADAKDYAAALDNFARLYLDMGHPELAMSMERHVLAICKKLQDHAAIARSDVTLANLELNQGQRRKSQKFLSAALLEGKQTSTLDDDFFATIASTQGWIAQLANDNATAISSYARAVELWTRQHGQQHLLTGWGYMLLGRSYAQTGQHAIALDNMRKGLKILEKTASATDPKYLAAELAYSQELDQAGEHVEASRIKTAAEQGLKNLPGNRCIRCQISVAALH